MYQSFYPPIMAIGGQNLVTCQPDLTQVPGSHTRGSPISGMTRSFNAREDKTQLLAHTCARQQALES
jgi:hypothetical protein